MIKSNFSFISELFPSLLSPMLSFLLYSFFFSSFSFFFSRITLYCLLRCSRDPVTFFKYFLFFQHLFTKCTLSDFYLLLLFSSFPFFSFLSVSVIPPFQFLLQIRRGSPALEVVLIVLNSSSQFVFLYLLCSLLDSFAVLTLLLSPTFLRLFLFPLNLFFYYLYYSTFCP